MKQVGPWGAGGQAWLYLDGEVSKAGRIIWEEVGQDRVRTLGKEGLKIHYFNVPFMEEKYSLWYITH